jgi:hypothetical protein
MQPEPPGLLGGLRGPLASWRETSLRPHVTTVNMPTFHVETPPAPYDVVVERGILQHAAKYVPPKAGKVFVVSTEDVWRHQGARLEQGTRRDPPRSALPPRRRRPEAPGARRAPGRGDGPARRRPHQPGGRVRRRHRHGHGRLSGGHLHARHSGAADPHHAAGAGGRGHRRQDRRQPGNRQEPHRQLPPAAGRAHRSERARHAARSRIPRGPVRDPESRRDPQRAAVPIPRRAQRRRAGAPARSGGSHHRRVGRDQGASGFRRRARRRPAAHPEFRPYLRARARSRDRLHPLPAWRGRGLRHARRRVPGANDRPSLGRRRRRHPGSHPAVRPDSSARRHPAERLLARLASDKKTIQGKVHFVLPVRIGEVQVVSGIGDELVLAAIQAALA